MLRRGGAIASHRAAKPTARIFLRKQEVCRLLRGARRGRAEVECSGPRIGEFTPAQKDGVPVSVSAQVEFVFHLYWESHTAGLPIASKPLPTIVLALGRASLLCGGCDPGNTSAALPDLLRLPGEPC